MKKDTVKLTNGSRLFAVFSVISMPKSKWKRSLTPGHPAVVVDFANRTVRSTADATGAFDTNGDRGYDLVKAIVAKIKNS